MDTRRKLGEFLLSQVNVGNDSNRPIFGSLRILVMIHLNLGSP